MSATNPGIDLLSDPRFSTRVSVIIPTINERDNVERLFERLKTVLDGFDWEAIFVDDGSTDGTAALIVQMSRFDRRIRLISRIGRRGLSSAVIEGILSSTAEVVAVIDADLQHDERVLPQLVVAVSNGKCDLAVGSRYVRGGSVGEWSRAREWASRIATVLASAIVAAPLADPMSGFFAIRRDNVVLAAPHLSGRGYKILLDLIASSPKPLSICEFPYCFRQREAGASKLTSMVALEYLRMLVEKSAQRSLSVCILPYAMIGAFGLVASLAVLART